MDSSQTVVALLTPHGRGAIATIAVRGKQALSAVQQHLTWATGEAIDCGQLNQVRFGWFRNMHGSQEEVIVVVTGDEEVELHCHGGPAAAAAIQTTLVAAGALRINVVDWVASIGGDPTCGEAQIALASATTTRTCAILLDQYRGALAGEFSQIESLLEQPEAQTQREASRRIAALLEAWTHLGQHLTRPWNVVLAGPPNAGKSSLINALLGYRRSIVSDQPGTTRDCLAALTAIDGWPVFLSDTAGLRTANDPLEAAGVERTSAQLEQADRVLLVVDAATDSYPFLNHYLSPSSSGQRLLLGNKCDLLSDSARAAWCSRYPEGLLVSALTGEGIDSLLPNAISRLLVQSPPAPGAAIPFLPRHAEYLKALSVRLASVNAIP